VHQILNITIRIIYIISAGVGAAVKTELSSQTKLFVQFYQLLGVKLIFTLNPVATDAVWSFMME